MSRILVPPSTIRSARLPYWAVALTALFSFACSEGTGPVFCIRGWGRVWGGYLSGAGLALR